MAPRALALLVFLGAVCVAQALKCNFCQKIDKDNPNCNQMDISVKDCPSGLNNCITIRMHHPAYGEVRRCATDGECEAREHHLVNRTCCSTDLCN